MGRLYRGVWRSKRLCLFCLNLRMVGILKNLQTNGKPETGMNKLNTQGKEG